MIMDLVIPFYNPQPGWEVKFVHKFHELITGYFDGDEAGVHVIVVNDGSQNRFTEKEIKHLKDNIPNIEIICYEQNRGKGFALRTGVDKARTGFCIYSDNDFPFGLAVIREMYDILQKDADIVTGCRTGGNYFKHLPFKRKLISKGLAWINKYMLRLQVTDTQAGIKAFNNKGKAAFLKTTTDRFLFDLEFILLAGKVPGMRIREIDVNIAPGVKMFDLNRNIILQEFRNLIRIIFSRRNEK